MCGCGVNLPNNNTFKDVIALKKAVLLPPMYDFIQNRNIHKQDPSQELYKQYLQHENFYQESRNVYHNNFPEQEHDRDN